MTIRSFIALPISASLSCMLSDVSAEMSYQDKAHAVRWVNEENYHLTLAFLAEQELSQLDNLADNLEHYLDSVLSSLDEPKNDGVILTHLSPFPESKPKLLVAMAKKTKALSALYQQVNKALRASNMQLEKRRFNPHITLGRYRHSKKGFGTFIPQMIEGSSAIETVTLFESILTPTGAIYQPLYEFDL